MTGPNKSGHRVGPATGVGRQTHPRLLYRRIDVGPVIAIISMEPSRLHNVHPVLTVVPAGYKTERLKWLKLLNEPLTSLVVEVRQRTARLEMCKSLGAPAHFTGPLEAALADLQRVVNLIQAGKQAEVDAELKAERKKLTFMRGCRDGGLNPLHFCIPRCQGQLEPRVL